MLFISFAWLFLWIRQDSVSCENTNHTYLVTLGGSLRLNCTYNCSTGFVRGCWKTEQTSPVCISEKNHKDDICTVFLDLANVSAKDVRKYYLCYTEVTDDPQLRRKTERTVLLQFRDETGSAGQTVTYKTETTNISLSAQPKDLGAGDSYEINEGMKILAAVTITVALVLTALAVYLCLNRSRQRSNGKDQPLVAMSRSRQPSNTTLPPNKGPSSTQSDRVVLRIPTPDNESDTEVPYADIVISIRGASTPELTQAVYTNSGDEAEWWGVTPRAHLQAARSADMLHVPQQREVSRKMSTNSEYAVIIYA